MSVFVNNAEAYWTANLPVMPVRGKRAFITGWQRFSSEMPSEEERRQWLSAYPTLNIGLPLGPASGLFVIDIDTRDPELEARIRAELPPSPWERIGSKGAALVYRWQPTLEKFKVKGQDGVMAVEGLGEGNQIVCPPSIHPDTKLPYVANSNLWDVLDGVGELPPDIAARLQAIVNPGGEKVVRGHARGPATGAVIVEGGRHDALVGEASRLNHLGLTGSQLLAALRAFNDEHCSPPQDDAELQAIVRHATEKWVGGDGLPSTEMGNARRLVAALKGTARYVIEERQWTVWDEARWITDHDGAVVRAAKAVADELLCNAGNSKERNAAARRAQTKSGIKNMIDLAASEPGVPVSAAEFDANLDTINTPAGIVNLKTGELMPADPAKFHSKLTLVAFDPHAECPTFMRFLSDIQPDPDAAAFLQRFAGYCLTGRTDEHKFLVASGSGRNGKSLLFNTLAKAMGDYAKNTPMSTFVQRAQNAPTNDLAALKGARLVLANEGNRGQALDTAMVKGMTGGDPITARRLYQEHVTFAPTFKPVIISNHMPEMDATDPAIWARLLVLPFERVFLGEDCDPHLDQKLEAELPGILRWAVDGAVAWYRSRLSPPPRVTDAVTSTFAEMDIIGSFLSERCAVQRGATAGATHLYFEFERYARDVGVVPPNQTVFGRELGKRGHPKRKTGGNIVREGLSLKPLSLY